MRTWRHLTWLTAALLAPAAYAAEAELAIELPDVALVLPRVSPPHFQKEGLPYATENELVTRLLASISRQDYEAALAAAREALGDELALLESGDPSGLLPRITGPGRLPIPTPISDERVSASLLYLLGIAYLGFEQYLPAETAFKAALVPLPDYSRVHASLGALYIETERFEEAQAHLARAAELGLNTAGLHASLGHVNAQLGNWPGAVSAYQQALTLQHDNRNVQTALLQALTETKQYAAGLALAEQLLRDEPDDPDLWLYRAHMALNAGARELALTSLESAIRLGDDSVANMQVAATLHMEQGSTARAVELLRSASAEALDFQFLDQALAYLGSRDEWDYFRELLAAAVERRASLDSLELSRLLTRRASLELHDGNRRAAIDSLREAVDLDGANAEALLLLGRAYREERDYARAELALERASAFELHRENALVTLAQIAIDRQDFERALALLRDVVSRNPARTDLQRNVDVLENLVLARSVD